MTTYAERIEALRPFAEEPKRVAMSRGTQFPTASGRIQSLELELQRMRIALAEALMMCQVLLEEQKTDA